MSISSNLNAKILSLGWRNSGTCIFKQNAILLQGEIILLNMGHSQYIDDIKTSYSISRFQPNLHKAYPWVKGIY